MSTSTEQEITTSSLPLSTERSTQSEFESSTARTTESSVQSSAQTSPAITSSQETSMPISEEKTSSEKSSSIVSSTTQQVTSETQQESTNSPSQETTTAPESTPETSMKTTVEQTTTTQSMSSPNEASTTERLTSAELSSSFPTTIESTTARVTSATEAVSTTTQSSQASEKQSTTISESLTPTSTAEESLSSRVVYSSTISLSTGQQTTTGQMSTSTEQEITTSSLPLSTERSTQSEFESSTARTTESSVPSLGQTSPAITSSEETSMPISEEKTSSEKSSSIVSPTTQQFTNESEQERSISLSSTTASSSTVEETGVVTSVVVVNETTVTPLEFSTSGHVVSDEDFFLYGLRAGDSSFYSSDDGSVVLLIPRGVNFFGDRFNFLYISINGLISFGRRVSMVQSTFSRGDVNVIAPLSLDLDLGGSNGAVGNGVIYYKVYEYFDINTVRGTSVWTLYDRVKSEILQAYGDDSFNPSLVAIITWINCPRYPYYISRNLGETASFQLVVTEDYSRHRSYVFFVYGSVVMRNPDISNFQGYTSSHGDHYELPTSNIKVIGLDRFIGNTGKPGLWIFRTSYDWQELNEDSAEYKCFLWNNEQKSDNRRAIIWFIDLFLPHCPCTYFQAIFDGRFFPAPGRDNCIVSSTFSRYARMCCYLPRVSSFDFLPYGSLDTARSYSAGSLLTYHPWRFNELYELFDDLPKKHCCLLSNNCELFYELRPSDNCFWYRPPFFSWMWGDPHISTIDGRKYSYQGLGTFWLLKGDRIQIQGQTKRIRAGDGGALTNGTVWSAIAIKDTTVTNNTNGDESDAFDLIFTRLTADSKGLDIIAQSSNLTEWFNTNPIETDIKQPSRAFIEKRNKTLTIRLPSGIAVKVQIGEEQLVLNFIFPQEFVDTSLSGLLGNANGNLDDDFQLPDGTTLPSNMSQREIYYKFGEHWKIPSGSAESLFGDDIPDGSDNYSPLFTDELQPDGEMSAICGNDSFCLVDLQVTRNKNFAQKTRAINEDNTENKIVLEKDVPTIIGPSRIYITVGQVTTVIVSSNNTDTPITFTISPSLPDGAAFDSGTGTFTWNVTDYIKDPINITFGGYDKDGTSAVPLAMTVILCNCTNSTGTCREGLLSQVEGYNFQIQQCQCHDSYTGRYCTEIMDYCVDAPCVEGARCVSLPPGEQQVDGHGYNCTDCPSGYEEVVIANAYSKCEDIDECSNNTTNGCDHVCINTEGSYTCQCHVGYEKVNERQCRDIDECETGIARCKQICTNTNGSFECSCFEGYKMEDDCVQDSNTKNACLSLTCQHGCRLDNGSAVCFCNRGYKVNTSNDTLCEDINECLEDLDQCGPNATCINENGTYSCRCETGYVPNPDQRSCRACDLFFWGDNCTNECKKCANVSSCDNVNGCTQCIPGWKGPFCDTDVDECLSNPCGNHSTCINYNGTFQCSCNAGYKSTNKGCEEVDDCLEEDGVPRLINPCNNGTCVDRLMGFDCRCLPGYTGEFCLQDIDDCINNGCQHGSTCVDGVNLYSCLCREGFAGGRCENLAYIPRDADDAGDDEDFVFAGSLVLTNETWSEALKDPKTEKYKELYSKTIYKIKFIYSYLEETTVDSYKKLSDVKFMRGSVVVSWLLHLNKSVDPVTLATAISSRTYVFNGLPIANITYTEVALPQPTDNSLYIALGTVGAVMAVAVVVLVVLFLLLKYGKLKRPRYSAYSDESSTSGYPPSSFGWLRGMRRYWQDIPSLRSSSLPDSKPDVQQFYGVPIPRPKLQQEKYEINWNALSRFNLVGKEPYDITGMFRHLPDEYIWTEVGDNSQNSTTS